MAIGKSKGSVTGECPHCGGMVTLVYNLFGDYGQVDLPKVLEAPLDIHEFDIEEFDIDE